MRSYTVTSTIGLIMIQIHNPPERRLHIMKEEVDLAAKLSSARELHQIIQEQLQIMLEQTERFMRTTTDLSSHAAESDLKVAQMAVHTSELRVRNIALEEELEVRTKEYVVVQARAQRLTADMEVLNRSLLYRFWCAVWMLPKLSTPRN